MMAGPRSNIMYAKVERHKVPICGTGVLSVFRRRDACATVHKPSYVLAELTRGLCEMRARSIIFGFHHKTSCGPQSE